MNIIKQLIEELEQAKKVCPRCNGSRWIIIGYNPRKDDIEDRPCPECLGRGYVLPEEVEKLVETLHELVKDMFYYNPWKGEYEI